VRRFSYNVLSRDATMTASIQPPLLAWAWRIAVGDPRRVSGIARHHEWLEGHRELDGDGLIWIVQPDESGLDASPQFDAIWGRHAHGLPGFVSMVRRNRRLGYDLRQILPAGGPACCEVMTNVLYGLSRLAMGKPSLTPAIVRRMYDSSSGLFWPLVRPEHAAWPLVRPPQSSWGRALAPRRPALTWAALSPLALPDLPEEIGRRLVEEYLLDPRRFWLPVPPSSVARSDRTFSRRDAVFPGLRRYWRGPTWMNAAWLLWLGLIRLGYEEQASDLTGRLSAVTASSGLREYYDPFTGGGMGATSFGWSALIAELVQPDPAAVSSHLQ